MFLGADVSVRSSFFLVFVPSLISGFWTLDRFGFLLVPLYICLLVVISVYPLTYELQIKASPRILSSVLLPVFPGTNHDKSLKSHAQMIIYFMSRDVYGV